jgi:hypothetical protein
MIRHHVALVCDAFPCTGIRNLYLISISTNESVILNKNTHISETIHACRCQENFGQRRYIDFLMTFVVTFLLEIYSNRADRIFFVSFVLCLLPEFSNAECNSTIVLGNNLHIIIWKRNFCPFQFEIQLRRLFVIASCCGTRTRRSRRRGSAGRGTGT